MSEPGELQQGEELLQDGGISQEPTIAAIQAAESRPPAGSASHRPSLSLTSLADLVRTSSPDLPGTTAVDGYTDSEDEEERADSPRGSISHASSADLHEHADNAQAKDTGDSLESQSRIASAQQAQPDTDSTGRSAEADLALALQASLTLSTHPSSTPSTPTLPGSSSSQPHHHHHHHHHRHTSLVDRSLSAALEDDTQESWMHHLKHFFILSSSGKPIYSYHGEESALAGLMALITALVSVVQDQGDCLQHIVSGSTLIVFVSRGPLVLVATTRLGEPILALQRQLELLYRQVLLVVTTGLERLLTRNPAYDPQSLLQGVNSTLHSLVHQMRLDPSYLLGALRPFPLQAADRAAVQQVLGDALKGSPAYYALLMIGAHIVAYERAKQQPTLEPLDVLLLSNFITSNQACRSGVGEVFCPVCLPGYNADAFLHAHIHYLERDAEAGPQAATAAGPPQGGPGRVSTSGSGSGMGPGAGVYLVLLAGSSETFHQLSAACGTVRDQLLRQDLLHRIHRAEVVSATAAAAAAVAAAAAGFGRQGATGGVPASNSDNGTQQRASSSTMGGGSEIMNAFGVEEPIAGDVGVMGHVAIEQLPKPAGGRFGCTPLWHFMCRFPGRHQVLSALPCPLHTSLGARQQLACAYAQLYSLVLDCPNPAKPNRLVWLATDRQAMLASLDSDLELYLVFDPLTDEATATQVADTLRKHFTDKRLLADLLLTPDVASAYRAMTQVARTVLHPDANFHAALRKVFGIGATTALSISEACGISSGMKVRDVKEHYILKVSQHIRDNYVVGDQLKRKLRDNILQLIEMNSQRGIRHELGLSQHGRTHTNNSTAKKLRHHIMYDTSRR